MQLWKFWHEAGKRQDDYRREGQAQRYGQTCFNLLAEVRPELAEEIRGTDKDPFYNTDSRQDSWIRFVHFLTERWGE